LKVTLLPSILTVAMPGYLLSLSKVVVLPVILDVLTHLRPGKSCTLDVTHYWSWMC